jgi:hypothetical protein
VTTVVCQSIAGPHAHLSTDVRLALSCYVADIEISAGCGNPDSARSSA